MTRATVLCCITRTALTIPLAVGHALYAWWLSMILYQASGGIRKQPSGWTEFGGASHAWTIPLQLPGTLVTRLGQWLYEPAVGTLLVLAASVLTAYAIASLIVAFFSGRQPVFGRFYWRIVIILLGLLWIPVREDLAEVWQYTVAF